MDNFLRPNTARHDKSFCCVIINTVRWSLKLESELLEHFDSTCRDLLVEMML